MHHTDDIFIVTFNEDGSTRYTTSVNKHQAGPVNEVRLGSFFSTSVRDTLKIIYVDFEYNYNAQGKITKASQRTASKTPVIANIFPDGSKQVRPIQNTRTGRNQNLYLVPSTAYHLKNGEFIVAGSGSGYYKFGKVTF